MNRRINHQHIYVLTIGISAWLNLIAVLWYQLVNPERQFIGVMVSAIVLACIGLILALGSPPDRS